MYYYVYYLKCKSKEIVPEEFIHDFKSPVKKNLERYNVFWSPKPGETPGNYMVKCGELPPFVEKEERLRGDIGKIAGYYTAWVLDSAETKYELELKIAEPSKSSSKENLLPEEVREAKMITKVAEPPNVCVDVFEVPDESDIEREELMSAALKNNASLPKSRVSSVLNVPRSKNGKVTENGFCGPFGPVESPEKHRSGDSESSEGVISDDEPQCISCLIITEKNLDLRLENQKYKNELSNLREKNKELMDKLNEIQKEIRRISVHFT